MTLEPMGPQTIARQLTQGGCSLTHHDHVKKHIISLVKLKRVRQLIKPSKQKKPIPVGCMPPAFLIPGVSIQGPP